MLVLATVKLLGFGFNGIEAAYIGPGYECYEGKTVHQLARENHMSDLKMHLKLCRESDYQGRVNMGPYTTDEIIHEFEKNERWLYMTNAWAEDYGVQNPSIYDCFPKFLRDSLLGLGDTMPNIIHRMTGANTERFGIRDRGYLREGCFADVTVFDEAALRNAVPDQAHSFGIKDVFVNGEELLKDGRILPDAKCGRAIRV